MFSLSIGLALLSQNYWCRLTSTLYKPDNYQRRTVGVGPDGVRLGESLLQPLDRVPKLHQLKLKRVNATVNKKEMSF